MAQSEIPLQVDMFTGALRDTRTGSQKEAAKERSQPHQQMMFPQREIAQFGVRARPQMSLSPHTKLALVMEDPRTEEEIERDRQRAAERLTKPLFVSEKETAYVRLVTAAAIAWAALHQESEGNKKGQSTLTTFASAREAAEQKGLTEAERQLAIIIGLYRGKQQAAKVDHADETSALEPPPLPNEVEEPPVPTDEMSSVRLAVYLRLVQLGEEQNMSIEKYPDGFAVYLTLTVLDAQNYGLRREEIHAAIQIGQFRNK